MDSRKLFGSVVAISLLAALLLGSVYAWETLWEADKSSYVGSMNNFQLTYVDTGDLLGPDGFSVTVANGSILKNDGDFALLIDRGEVIVDNIDHNAPGDGLCEQGHFAGSVDIKDPGPVEPGEAGGDFKVKMLTNLGVPEDCQGDEVFYTVRIYLENPPPP